MTGLAAADSLRQAGRNVCVVEAAAEAGGLTRSIELGGETIEAYYHHAFPQDRELHDLVRRIGLADRFEWWAASTAVLHDGRLYPFDSLIDLLHFGALPRFARVRLGMGGLVALVAGRRAGVARSAVSRSGPRWFGRRGYELLWRPLLEGKFGPMADDVSMAWLAARMRQRANARKSGRGDELGYLRGGFGVVATELARDLRARQVDIRFGTQVRSIERTEGGWLVRAGDETLVAPAVVAAVSSAALGSLVELPADYARKVEAIPYRGVVCVLLELDRSLSSFYWTNLAQPSPFSTLAVIEHTNMVPPDRYGGRHLVYLTHYVDPAAPVWSASADDIVEALEPTLRAINPAFDKRWIRQAHVSRDRWAQPVPLVDGGMGSLPLETGLPGLFNASIAHIYPDDRGLALAIRLGRKVGELANDWLARPAERSETARPAGVA